MDNEAIAVKPAEFYRGPDGRFMMVFAYNPKTSPVVYSLAVASGRDDHLVYGERVPEPYLRNYCVRISEAEVPAEWMVGFNAWRLDR